MEVILFHGRRRPPKQQTTLDIIIRPKTLGTSMKPDCPTQEGGGRGGGGGGAEPGPAATQLTPRIIIIHIGSIFNHHLLFTAEILFSCNR